MGLTANWPQERINKREVRPTKIIQTKAQKSEINIQISVLLQRLNKLRDIKKQSDILVIRNLRGEKRQIGKENCFQKTHCLKILQIKNNDKSSINKK